MAILQQFHSPWQSLRDMASATWKSQLPKGFGGHEDVSGDTQILLQGKKWLWLAQRNKGGWQSCSPGLFESIHIEKQLQRERNHSIADMYLQRTELPVIAQRNPSHEMPTRNSYVFST